MTALPWHRQEREREGEPGGGEVGGTNGELPQARPRVLLQSLNLQLAHPEPERGPAAGTGSLGRLAQGSGSAQSVQWPPKERERERINNPWVNSESTGAGFSQQGFGATRAGCG